MIINNIIIVIKMTDYLDYEDKILIAIDVNPNDCIITTQSTIWDFYFYHCYNESPDNDLWFNTLLTEASKKLGLHVKEEDYIVDLARKLYDIDHQDVA